nr:class I SAM-dependent methyltransferase [Sphingobium subterraneum]
MDAANRKPSRLAVGILNARDGERVLDAGCGTGATMAQMLRKGRCHVTGVDRSATMIRRARARMKALGKTSLCELAVGEIGHLPFVSNSYDAALALNVFYFCGDDGAMVTDLRRVLRPGGRLVAYVTHRRSMAGWSFTSKGTHRLFDQRELTALLVQGGFDPTHIHVEVHEIAHKVAGLFALARA